MKSWLKLFDSEKRREEIGQLHHKIVIQQIEQNNRRTDYAQQIDYILFKGID